MRKIYFTLDSTTAHSMYRNILANPVPGWIYATRDKDNVKTLKSSNDSSVESLEKLYSGSKFLRNAYYYFSRALSVFMAPKKFLGFLEYFRHKKKLESCDIVYSPNGLPIYVDVPWITDFETVHTSFVCDGVSESFAFKLHKRYIEKLLASPNCKKILPYFDVSRKNMLAMLDCKDFEDKIETVYLGIKSIDVKRRYDHKIINLLFVDSGNIGLETQFYFKGGEEAILTYLKLRKTVKNIKLTIRSSYIPEPMKKLIEGLEDVHVIEKRLSESELKNLFLDADILFLPYFTVSSSVFLEGMNFILPIVTMDGWGSKEFIEDGKCGYVIPKSRYFTAFSKKFELLNGSLERHKVDSVQIDAYVDRLKKLVKSADLRRKMGEYGKNLVTGNGKFSIETRQKNLARIFKEALKK